MSAPSELHYVFVCQGKNCVGKGAAEMLIQIRAQLADNDSFRVVPSICFGACTAAPNVAVFPDRLWYSTMIPQDIERLVECIRRGEERPEFSGKVSADLKSLVFRLFGKPFRL